MALSSGEPVCGETAAVWSACSGRDLTGMLSEMGASPGFYFCLDPALALLYTDRSGPMHFRTSLILRKKFELRL